MHVAFVQHAQHDVHRGNGRQDQNDLRVHGVLEHLRRTGKAAAHGGGHPKLGHGAVNGIAGLRQRRAGWQVKRHGRGGGKPLVVYRQRRVRRLPAGEVRQRDRLAVIIDHKHLVQRADVLGVARINFHYHLVLVHRLIDGGDFTLPEGVVKQAVGRLHVNAQAGHSFTIVGERHLRAVVLAVGVHVRQLRQRGQRFTDLRLPLAQGG